MARLIQTMTLWTLRGTVIFVVQREDLRGKVRPSAHHAACLPYRWTATEPSCSKDPKFAEACRHSTGEIFFGKTDTKLDEVKPLRLGFRSVPCWSPAALPGLGTQLPSFQPATSSGSAKAHSSTRSASRSGRNSG